MTDRSIEEVELALAWWEQSAMAEVIILIGVYYMAYKRWVTSGVVVALALLVGWGLLRDPLLLVSALMFGFISGMIYLYWLLK